MTDHFFKAPGAVYTASGKKKKRRRRVMRSFKMEEISSVDTPAQEHATMTLMKRKDDSELVEKVLLLTSLNENHQHMLSIDFDSLEHGGGHTDWASGIISEINPGSPEHQHSYIINPDGTITIAATNGHTHSIEMGEFMGRLRLQTALASSEVEDEPELVFMHKIEEGKEFIASDFALVLDPTRPSTWKYRLVGRSGGNPDHRLVGTAVGALKMGKIAKNDRASFTRRVRSAWTKSHRSSSRADMPPVLKRVSC